MVVGLDHSIFSFGLIVPAVQPEFPDNIRTAFTDVDASGLQQRGRVTDAVQNAVVGFPHPKYPVPPDTFNKAGGRRVYDHIPHIGGNISGKLFQCSVVLLVCSGMSLFSGIIIVLPDSGGIAVSGQVP